MPAEWQASYPLFEGDYFSVTLPVSVSGNSTPEEQTENQSELSAPHPDSVTEHTNDIGGSVESVATPLTEEDIRKSVEQKVELIVSHMGFANPAERNVFSKAYFGIKRFFIRLFRREDWNPADPKKEDVLTKEFFGVEPHLVNSGGGDILKVAQINCENGPQPDPDGPGSFCQMEDWEQQQQLIVRATGMPAEDYLDRKLNRYFFYQRPQYRKWPTYPRASEELCNLDPGHPGKCNVFIEHTVIAATTRPKDGTVTSIEGRIFPRYKITNRRKLDPNKAIEKAYQHLWKIPEISAYSNQPGAEPDPPLVLLPYAHAVRFDLSLLGALKWPFYRTPQLRYAYRTTLYGNFKDKLHHQVEAASWRVWVDAETGDILQIFPQFAFASAKGKGWPQTPSRPVADGCLTPGSGCPGTRVFEVDDVDPGEKYCLELSGVIDKIQYADETALCIDNDLTGTPDFAEGLDCASPWDCLCQKEGDSKASRYLPMNAYAHVYAYKKKLDAAICHSFKGVAVDDPPICVAGVFQAAKNEAKDGYVPLRLKVGGVQSVGKFAPPAGKPHLTFAETDEIFITELCGSNVLHSDLGKRPGAQDATLMTHEFAHVVMFGLLNSRCDPADCPEFLHPGIVHDMADGLSAISNVTDQFGEWWGNHDPGHDSEVNGPFRKFDYGIEFDHFPEHRNWLKLRNAGEDQWISADGEIKSAPKGYADGQIAAAALWAVTESMNDWVGKLGPASFEADLLQVLQHHFYSTTCTYFEHCESPDECDCDSKEKCDLDVYRYLHFLLRDLTINDVTNEVTVTTNKKIAGFARTGIFLVPPRCIGASTDAEPADGENDYCPGGIEYGGDAVIDITHDWLDRGGIDEAGNVDSPDVPEFEVWTGPLFRFQDDHAELVQTPPCNRYFKISIANNSDFKNDGGDQLSKDTAWLEDTDGDCEAHWPEAGEWDEQWDNFWSDITQKSRNPELDLSKAYYRVVTSDSNITNAPVLSSSEYPGKLFPDKRVGPPFAILNDTGQQQPEKFFPDETNGDF
jgi:hypothetical protein